jgi:hypothetical protein
VNILAPERHGGSSCEERQWRLTMNFAFLFYLSKIDCKIECTKNTIEQNINDLMMGILIAPPD